jgi:phosphoglycerol transferase MdoB-like AlkP superfamily enzyme
MVFLLSMYALYLYVLLFHSELSDIEKINHDLVRVVLPLLELSLFNLICVACMHASRRRQRKLPWLVLAMITVSVAYIIYMAQIFSLYLSDNFISVLALKNTESSGFVTSPRVAKLAALALAWLLFFLYGLAREFYPTPNSRTASSTGYSRRKLMIVLVATILVNCLSLALQQKKSQRLEAAFWQVPVANFLHNFVVAKFDLDKPLDEEIADDGAGMQCFSYPPAGAAPARYPFQKNKTYTDPLPFAARADHKGSSAPNVIVIFSEGTSARLLGAYGGHYDKLTPNIDALAEKSMQVENYFNHTAATYRGLIGQLSSGYSAAGGGGRTGWESGTNKSALSEIRRQTLPRIMRESGYQSYFFSPHRSERPFTLMLRSLGFDEVYTYQSIGDGLLKGKYAARHNTGALDDESLFAGLTEFLRQRAVSPDGKPFFIATYNIGTHAFIDINPQGDVAYGDGSKAFLNKIHNYDASLGPFLSYFFKSPFARNTILIFTSDHSTYPEPMFRAVVGKDLKPYFVDRIPLLIYDPVHGLSGKFDAHGRNSLDLAPTILQLLGQRDVANSFLGHSLFEPRNFPIGIASLGGSYYMTTEQGVFGKDEIPAELEKQFDCEINVVRRYYGVEKTNHIFRAN